jgi:hypothetical protein
LKVIDLNFIPRYNLEYPKCSDVTEFAKWYTDNKCPIIINSSPKIYITENATSYVAFQQGRFQAEMYVAHPCCDIETPKHSHPGMDIITIPFDFYDSSINWGKMLLLKSGDYHEASFTFDGSVFLTCQHWIDNREMTSAAVNWTGKLVGPMQERMIRKYYPNAIIENGFSDTTMVDKQS